MNIKLSLAVFINGAVLMALEILGGRDEITSPSDVQKAQEKPLDISIESPYGQIRVWDDQDIRRLTIAGGWMSAMHISDDSLPVEEAYFEYMEYPFLLNPRLHSVLAIGLGGGTFAKNVHRRYGVDLDVAEINPVVVEVAKKYFNVKISNSFKIFIEDGRRFLNGIDKKYDLISLDVFHYASRYGHKIPFHLATREFFELAKKHLTARGVFLMVFVTKLRTEFFLSEIKTLDNVFNTVYVFDNEPIQIVIAFDFPEPPATAAAPGGTSSWNSLLPLLYRVNKNMEGIVLTDEYAPINPFERLIRKEGSKEDFILNLDSK